MTKGSWLKNVPKYTSKERKRVRLLIKQSIRNGAKTREKIAKDLHDLGVKTPQGKDVTAQFVSNQMAKMGLRLKYRKRRQGKWTETSTREKISQSPKLPWPWEPGVEEKKRANLAFGEVVDLAFVSTVMNSKMGDTRKLAVLKAYLQ